MMWTLFIAAIAIWVLQTVLTLWQFRRFNRRLKELRQLGPVAIGKVKGRFLAGAIVLLCIDAAAASSKARSWRASPSLPSAVPSPRWMA